MTIPSFQNIMLPLLQLASDGAEHSVSEAVESIATYFELSDAEREEPLPSGRQLRFDNRVGWATTHLKKALLLESTGRGYFCITERGLTLLAENPAGINLRLLRRYPEFVEFRESSRSGEETSESEDSTDQTPEELLEISYQQLRNELASELLAKVRTCSWRFFERLVVNLLVAMGYGGSRKDAGLAFEKSGDDGIDGMINEDRLGLDVIFVQAKKWDSKTVGRPDVQAFAGSLEGVRARKGVFITTSSFSRDARDYVTRIEKRIVLIDGEQLSNLMIDFGIGVANVETYTIKRIDSDYFEHE